MNTRGHLLVDLHLAFYDNKHLVAFLPLPEQAHPPLQMACCRQFLALLSLADLR